MRFQSLYRLSPRLALELFDRLVVYTGTSSIRFDSLECLPDERLGNCKRLRHVLTLLLLAQLA